MIISIPIQPVAASRPRVTNRGVYYSKEYESFKKALPILAGRREKIKGAIEAYIEFHFAAPKSWTKKKKSEMIGRMHTQKPDIDNLQKAVLDGLNGIAYDDDSQVCQIFAVKRWAESGKIVVKLTEVKETETELCNTYE